jgi:hypothetical protein
LRLLKIPWRYYLLWLILAAWFALGVGVLRTTVERESYAQARALARLSADLTRDRVLIGADAAGARPLTARQRPGVALCALPFYLVGRVMAEFLHDEPANTMGFTAQITSLAAPVAMATAIVLLGLCGLSLGIWPRSALVLGLLLAVATPCWSYGARLSPPAFGLLAISLMLYALLRIAQNDRRVGLRFMLGAGIGLSLLLGDEHLATLPFFLLWSLAYARRIVGRPGYALAFLLPLSAGGLLFAWYNQVAWGGWWRAPDGAPLWTHLRRDYWQHAAVTQSVWNRYLWPGLRLWLFSDGPMPVGLAMARGLPAPLREVVFYGVFVWCPLLIVGALGAWALLRDPDAGGPLRLLLIAFAIALFMRVLAREIVPPAGYNAADTLPFWPVWLIGLGFFIEVHIFSLRIGVIRLLLVAGFFFVTVVSLANAAHDAALGHLGLSGRSLFSTPPPAQAPPDLGSRGPSLAMLPVTNRDAFFLPLRQVTDWATRSPRALASALWPGLGNWPLFLPILLVIGAIPPAAGWLFHRRLRRPREEEEERDAQPEEKERRSGDDTMERPDVAAQSSEPDAERLDEPE